MNRARGLIGWVEAGLLAIASSLCAQTWVWNLDGNGDWTTAGNWLGPGGYPDGVGHVADFAQFNITTARRYIRIEDSDNLITIGTLLIGDGDRPYTFSNRTDHTTWVFADTDGLAEIVVSNAYSTDASRPHRIDGIIALSNDLRVSVLTAPVVPLFFWGAVTSDVSGVNLIKDGRGTMLVLTSAQWSGETRIQNGRLWLATNGVLTATTAVELRPGATLIIDNAPVNLGNRVPDAAPIRSFGGALSFVHTAAAGEDYSETLGQLQLLSGSLTVTSSMAAAGQTSTLTFGSAARETGVVAFVSAGFSDPRNQIIFTTAPTLAGQTHSDIVPYMVARTNGGVGVDAVLVTHDGDGTPLRAYGTAPNETYATSEADFVATTNARPPVGTTLLSAARAVQALVLDDGVNIAASGANRTLRVTNGVAGIVLQTGGTSVFNPSTASQDAVLTFDAERGIIYTVGTLELRRRSGSALNTCIRGTNGFVKAGPGDLVISNKSQANNATVLLNLRGVISIDEGRLIAQDPNAFGGAVVMLNGGVLALMDNGNRKFQAQDVSVTNTPIIVQAAVGTVLVGRATSASTATRHTVGQLTMRPGTTLFVNFTNITGDTDYELIADGLVMEGDATIRINTGPGSGDGRLIITNQTLGGLTDGGAGYNLTVLGTDIIRSELRVLGTLNLAGDLRLSPEFGAGIGVWADDGFANVLGNITVGNGMLIMPISFSRELGAGPGQIRFVNGLNAGVGVVGGGTIGVALTSGGQTNMLTWGEGNFAVGSIFRLNEDDASGTLTFWNDLDLNSTNGTVTRTIQVDGGIAVLAGTVTNLDSDVGVANLTKGGSGTLIISNRLDHNGITTLSGAATRIPSPTNLAPGNLFISAANAIVTLDTSGIFTRPIGSGVGAVRILGSGVSGHNSRPGFNTWGGDLILDFGGDGSGTGPALVWNSADFDPEGPNPANTGAFYLNRSTADGVIYLLNAIDLNGTSEADIFARRFEVAGSVAVLGGQIYNSGSGFFDPIGILKRGAGAMVLAADNTYDGVTVIEAGQLIIGTNGTTGSLGLGNVTNDATLVFNRSNTYVATNLIVGSGSLWQVGSGVTVLTASNTYSGATTVSNGTLRINGSLTGGGLITVAGGRLEGNGSVAGAIDVQAGATLAPGASPGQFTANANVTLQSGAIFEVELNGTTPGALYDQLLMGSGTTLTLSNPTLSVILGFSPTIGDTFQIVSGFSTLSGSFNGLPTSGSTFMVGSTQFQIDYNTSDITLTVIPEPSTLGLLGVVAAAVLLRRRLR